MKKRVATLPKNNNHIYFSILSILIFSLLFLYMYLLSISVVHVVLRKQAINSKATIESEIAQLESRYIEAQLLVSNKIVATYGFNETSKKIFVSRLAPTFAMSDSVR